MSSRAPLLLVLAALTLSGCYSFEMSRIGRRVGQDIEKNTDAEVGGGVSMSVGPISLATMQLGAWTFAPVSTREARQIGRHVSSVKFSRRSVEGAFDGRLVGRPSYLQRYERGGWYPFVTVRDSSTAVWVMLRERGREAQITNLLAVVATDEDLIVTKVSGDLSDMIREAIELGNDASLLGGALRDAGLIQTDTTASGEDVEIHANL